MDKLKELEPNQQVLDMREVYKKEEREVSKRVHITLSRSRPSRSSCRTRSANCSRPSA
jgi:hypothetical protein